MNSSLYILHTSANPKSRLNSLYWNPLKDFIRAHSGEIMQTTIFNDWLNIKTITYSKLLVSKTALNKRKLFQKQTADRRTRSLKHLKICNPCIRIEKTKQSLSAFVQYFKLWLVSVGQNQTWTKQCSCPSISKKYFSLWKQLQLQLRQSVLLPHMQTTFHTALQ